MDWKVHVIPHMHWDREWYFTTEESRILLVNNMEEILERLENDEDYKYYMLDGQTAILEDYFDVKPENKERVRSLVQKGKLIIGPWYTQTDEMMVGGESIVRNLLYGIKDSNEFGDYMKIGYLPDSFGQSAQLPQILNGFGIKDTVFWRGCSERHGTNKTEFLWQSNDGSEVTAQILPLGYAIGKYLPLNEEELKDRLDKYFPVLERGAVTENLILPNGHDQMPLQQNIFEVMDMMKKIYPDKDFFISRYENIFAELEKNREKLDVIKGEFNDPKYMRVHRTISSTRMDIKIANVTIENKITNILEPLASIAYSLGFEYHHGLIELMWKEIMKNHAHDSISCCCTDQVHREIMARFELAHDKADKLIDFYKRKIVDAVKDKEGMDKLTVFNLLPYERTEEVETKIRLRGGNFTIYNKDGKEIPYYVKEKRELDPGLIDRQIVHYGNYDPFHEFLIQFSAENIPPMGYETFYIKYNTGNEGLKEITEEKAFIENKYYKITVNSNGTINLSDKRLMKEYRELLIAEDGSDDGDEYDYSPLKDDFIITNKDVTAEIKFEHTPFAETAYVSYEMDIPKDLESRKNKIKDSKMRISTEIKLRKNSDKVEIKTEIDNNSKDHRVRFIMPTGYKSTESVSDNQFGTIKRPVIDTANEVWEAEKWKEKPVPVYQMMSFTDLNDKNSGMSLLTNGLREYEITGEDFSNIALTLFRGVGLLGKEEMYYRPGRPSGIKLETPDSQMLGKLKFEFAVFIHSGDEIEGLVPQKGREYVTPVTVYNKIPYNAMRLNPAGFNTPDRYSLFGKKIEGSVLSAVKKAEREEALLIRIYNPNINKDIQDSLIFDKSIKNIYETNLNEDKVNDLNNADIILKPCQVKTVALSK